MRASSVLAVKIEYSEEEEEESITQNLTEFVSWFLMLYLFAVNEWLNLNHSIFFNH